MFSALLGKQINYAQYGYGYSQSEISVFIETSSELEMYIREKPDLDLGIRKKFHEFMLFKQRAGE